MSGFSAWIASAVLGVLVPAAALAEEAACADVRGEGGLLHRRLELRGVECYVEGAWRVYQPPGRGMLVLHLFSESCAPCVREFPVWRKIVAGWRDEATVSFLFVLDSESADVGAALRYFWQHRAELPEQAPCRSGDARLRAALESETKPITLLLDGELVVRQAFVGSVVQRRSEVVSAMRRLAGLLRAGPDPHRRGPRGRRGR